MLVAEPVRLIGSVIYCEIPVQTNPTPATALPMRHVSSHLLLAQEWEEFAQRSASLTHAWGFLQLHAMLQQCVHWQIGVWLAYLLTALLQQR